MRYHWAPQDTWSCSPAIFTVETYNTSLITTRANVVDLWVRAMSRLDRDSVPMAYITATKAEAEAIEDPIDTDELRLAAGVIAYWLDDGPFMSQTFPITMVADAVPDISGLTIGAAGEDPATADWDYLSGYFAAPEIYVLQEIKRLLRLRNGSGQLLAGYEDAAIERSYGDYNILSAANQIIAAHAEAVPVTSATNKFGLQVNWTVLVGKIQLAAPVNTDDLLYIGGGIRSLLGDEQRTLGGLCTDTSVTGVAGPTPAGGPDDHVYQTVRISGLCHFNPLRSDA